MTKIIYLRTNLINGKQYVGQTKDFKRRERDWRKLGSKYSNKELDNDRLNYGLENWKLDVLEEVDDELADETERKYIEKYQTIYPNGYNHNSRGVKNFTFNMTEETKCKISNTLKGVPKKFTIEGKENIAKSTKERLSKQVDQIDPKTGDVIASFPSAREAARKLGFSQCNISMCCNGGFFNKTRNKWVNRKQYNGYIWKRPM